MAYAHTLGAERFRFADLRTLLAKASPRRSGDELAGVAAANARERVAAQLALADLPLTTFLNEAVVPYESDEVTRLIVDTHDTAAFAPIAHLTVGGLRDALLADAVEPAKIAAGLTPEMAAAVSKLCRVQDLMLIAQRCEVVTQFRSTLGLRGRLATRLQPNHPTDDEVGIAASLLDGLLMGAGDAVIGINPATDNLPQVMRLMQMLDAVISHHEIPTQSCVLTHVTTTIEAIQPGCAGGPRVPVHRRHRGGQPRLRHHAGAAGRSASGGTGAQARRRQVMYFETGQGSALSSGAHHGCDQQTLECRAYAVARRFEPLLVNSVVGFIGPEYLFDGKQILRAGLEDHCAAKLLGLPMGVDVCFTNHAEADVDDLDSLLTLLCAAGCNYIMGVPGSDDIMLGYQSTSFHDALAMRRLLGLRPAPEFEAWLQRMGVFEDRRAAACARRAGSLFGTAGAGMKPPVVDQPWASLRRYTAARIGLGRAGASVPTAAHLAFQQAHAEARDAVQAPLDAQALLAGLGALGEAPLLVQSQAATRAIYLQRPDLGRRLSEASAALLAEQQSPETDLAFVLADGLSALALQRQALPLFTALRERLMLEGGWTCAPPVLATQARVALGDEIGALLNARCVVVLIGERPGLSAPDSLGVYFSWAPHVGLVDAERNCISNVRPEGLAPAAAAAKLHALLREARTRQLSGVALKDEQDDRALTSKHQRR